MTQSEKKKKIISELLAEVNRKRGIWCKEIDWQEYVFTTNILHIKFSGKLSTRKAIKGTVSPEKIFEEHLHDFLYIAYYCLFRNIPYIELATDITFDILTDRTKGIIYFTELVINYDEEEWFDFELEKIKKLIFELINDYNDLQGRYISSLLDLDEIIVKR